jgi:hypothetical protein
MTRKHQIAIGDKVRCTNANGHCTLAVGKEYTVSATNKNKHNPLLNVVELPGQDFHTWRFTFVPQKSQ